MKNYKADSLMLLITFFWGFTFIFTKLGLNSTNGSLFVLLRFLIAEIFVISFFSKYLSKFTKVTLKRGIILGLLYASGFVLQTYGLKYTTVPKSAFITGLAVPLVPFVFWFLERKKVQLFSKIGVIIATIGLWMFSHPNFYDLNLGDVLTLISTIFWALYITLMDVFTKDTEEFKVTVQLVFLQFLTIIVFSFITFLIFDIQNFFFNLNGEIIVALAYNGILASFFVTFIHTGYQKYTTPVKAALIFSLEPVIASVASIFIFQSRFSNFEIFGGVLMIIGVIISEIGGIFLKTYSKNKIEIS